MNQIYTIAPYRWHGQWVFDDSSVGLHREPFVGGADKMLDQVMGKTPRGLLLFSSAPFPEHQFVLDWTGEGEGGNYYYSIELGLTGWLCPALLRYFPEAPKHIFVSVKPLGESL